MRRFKKIFTPLLSLLICVSVFVSAPLSSSALLAGMPEDFFEATAEDTYSLRMISSDRALLDARSFPDDANFLPYYFSVSDGVGSETAFDGRNFSGLTLDYLEDGWLHLYGTSTVFSSMYFMNWGSNHFVFADEDTSIYLNVEYEILGHQDDGLMMRFKSYNAAGVGKLNNVWLNYEEGFSGTSQVSGFGVELENANFTFYDGIDIDIKFRVWITKDPDAGYSPYYGYKYSDFTANYNSWYGAAMNDGQYYGFINGFGNIGTVVPAVYGYEYRVSCKLGLNTDYNSALPSFTLLGVVPSSDLLKIDDLVVSYSYEDNQQYPILPDAAGNYVAWADVSFSFTTMFPDLPDELGLEFQTIFKNTYSVSRFILADFKIQTVNLVPTLVENSVIGILGVLNGTFIPGGGSDQIEDLNDRNQALTDSANNQQSGFLSQEELEQQYRENLLQYKDTAAFGEVSSQIRSFVLQYYDGFVWWRGAMDEILSFGPVIGLVSISVFVSCFFLLVKLFPTIGWLGRRERSKAEANERDRAREESRQREAAARERDSWRNRYRGPQD